METAGMLRLSITEIPGSGIKFKAIRKKSSQSEGFFYVKKALIFFYII